MKRRDEMKGRLRAGGRRRRRRGKGLYRIRGQRATRCDRPHTPNVPQRRPTRREKCGDYCRRRSGERFPVRDLAAGLRSHPLSTWRRFWSRSEILIHLLSLQHLRHLTLFFRPTPRSEHTFFFSLQLASRHSLLSGSRRCT